MTNEFDFLADEVQSEELPDWLIEASETDDESGAVNAQPDQEVAMAATVFESDPEADEFDLLRQRTARASEVYSDIEEEEDSFADLGMFTDEESGGRLSGLLASFAPAQKIVVALLLALNVLAAGVFVLTIMGLIQF